MAEIELKRIIRQVLPMLLLTGIFNIGTGGLLGGIEEQMGGFLPGILIMVPPLMDLKGTIAGALASRLGSGLHQGLIDQENMFNQEVKTNVKAAITLGFLTAIAIGTMATIITVTIMGTPFTLSLLIKLVSVALIAALISVVLLSGVSVLVAILCYRHGFDPGNFTSPILTTLGDILTLLALYIALIVVIGIASI